MSSAGKSAVIGQAVRDAAADLAARPAAEQTSMFPVPTRFSGDRAAHLQRAIEHKRDRGRPPGSTNKATEEWRKYLLERGKSPLQSLMEWSLHTPLSLAAELGCTRYEAMGLLVQMWRELAPFLHSKMVPVDSDGKPVPFLNVTLGAFAGAGAELPPWLRTVEAMQEMQQNQGLLASSEPVSHDAVSHEADK